MSTSPRFIMLSGDVNYLGDHTGDRRFTVFDISSSRPKSAIAAKFAREPAFARFLETIGFHACDEEACAAAIRELCMVESRADLDCYPVAASRFDALIIQPYALFRRMEANNAR